MKGDTVRKAVGAILYYAIAARLPVSHSRLRLGQTQLRRFCARLMLAECGKRVNVEKGAVFSTRVTIGDDSGIGINARIHGECHIGKDVMMGEGCIIHTRDHRHDRTDLPMRLQGFEPERPVYISDDVWICDRVTILPGVRVGRGSILAAGTVVARDVPEYAIVAGVPARVVGSRLENGSRNGGETPC